MSHEIKNYIPKFKLDYDAVEQLKLLPFETVRADVPILLEWMQDLNWGLGVEIGKYLSVYVDEVKEELLEILKTNDEIWKYNIIRTLIEESPIRPCDELMSVIKRIADYPTKSEKEEDVDEAAKDLIAQFSN